MESRKYTIHGPGLDNEKKKEASDFISSFEADAEEPVEGEVEKTPEIQQAILEINQYREEITQELGLSKPKPISEDQVHLLPPLVYADRYPDYPDWSEGVHENLGHGIFIKYRQGSNIELFKMFLLHEAIHMDSYQAYFTKNKKNDPIRSFSGQTRSGYLTRTPYIETENEYLVGFNEAVVQKIAWEKIRPHLANTKINISYSNEIEILDSIIQKIATKYSEDKTIVWDRIKKGLFTGEMMHLRRINETYGPKALEVLSLLTDEYGEATEKVKRYFKTDIPDERLKLEEDLLAASK